MESQFLYKAWANKEILDEMENIDKKKYPDKWLMAVRLLNHTHVVDNIFIAHLTHQRHEYSSTNTIETPDISDLRCSIEKSDQWLIQYSKDVNVSELEQSIRFTFTDGDAGSMLIRDVLSHLIIHGAYHRGNIGMLLADCGLSRPKDTFTRYLHNFAQL
jgi:uncharacterized damage-inducible protein DinB